MHMYIIDGETVNNNTDGMMAKMERGIIGTCAGSVYFSRTTNS